MQYLMFWGILAYFGEIFNLAWGSSRKVRALYPPLSITGWYFGGNWFAILAETSIIDIHKKCLKQFVKRLWCAEEYERGKGRRGAEQGWGEWGGAMGGGVARMGGGVCRLAGEAVKLPAPDGFRDLRRLFSSQLFVIGIAKQKVSLK